MPTQPQQATYDVIIIGGGPAGSASAITLAQHGYSTLVLEKSTFPRFHIGESLLAYSTQLLEKLQLLDKIEQGDFVSKLGAEFTDETGNFRRVNFQAQGEHYKHNTFQVERAQFDQLLLNEARTRGAQVLEGALVTGLLFDNDAIVGVQYTYEKQDYNAHARFVIDASGRAGKISMQLKLRKSNEHLKMVALFKHFGNLDEKYNPTEKGDIQIGRFEHGWIWGIPIHDDIISIGVVTPAKNMKASRPEDFFNAHYQSVPRITQRITDTHAITPLHTESDFCYRADTVAGRGYFIVGDAACFVDPIFSAGVYLAMTTGNKAGELISEILSNQRTAEDAIEYYHSFYKTGYDCYFRLIYAFYESNFDLAQYVKTIQVPYEARWIARLLSGDFWSRENAFAAYMRTQQRWDTFEPFELAHGCPIYPELAELEKLTTTI